MWTATHLNGVLVGIKLTSQGTTNQPKIKIELFLKNEPKPDKLNEINNP
jgi:hypothetical protein